MAEGREFTVNNIPWPIGVDKILFKVASHRRMGKSVASSVALGIVEESHDLSRETLRLTHARTAPETIRAMLDAVTVGSYYARPSYALLCAEEVLRSGEPSPAVTLPEEELAGEFMHFFTRNLGAFTSRTKEIVQQTEDSLAVLKAERLIIEGLIAAKLPGEDPADFVDLAMMEEIGLLNRAKGLHPKTDQLRRVALLQGSLRFSEVYDYALLRES